MSTRTDERGSGRLSAECFVAGRWVAGEGTYTVDSYNPATEELLGSVAAASPAQVNAAVEAARRAFDHGPWPQASAHDRAKLLRRLMSLMDDNRDELLGLSVAEVGTPVATARTLHVDLPLEHLGWYADAAVRGPRGGYEEGLPLHRDPVASASMLLREPAGVVAAITTFNVPILNAVWKIGGCLAAGCTAVVFPSPRAPLCTAAFVRLVEEAGIPDGVVNLVYGDADVGRQLTSMQGVDLVTFTGSVAVGSQVMAQAAPTIKRVVLELGGKSPNILLPGTDLDEAVTPSVLRFARNAGQGCGCTTRVFVHQGDYDEFVARAAEVLGSLEVGDPTKETTSVGPVIRADSRARIEGYVQRAVEDGARVEAGGGRPSLPRGWYTNPTLVGGVDNKAEICRDELFGPVGVVIPYDDLAEAVAMANDTQYGLNANVWGPVADAIGVARQIRSGTVTINGGGGQRFDAPWGGYRQSGLGREGGEEGFLEFFEAKHVQWPLSGPGRIPGMGAA